MPDTTPVTEPSEVMLGLNVQHMDAYNHSDKDGNPTGGDVTGKGLHIEWQNGPRGTNEAGELGKSNGAFVEDVLWAALQRLEYFEQSKYAHPSNAAAISHIHQALEQLNIRRVERADRSVEGQHKV